jgi:hypothetical protein
MKLTGCALLASIVLPVGLLPTPARAMGGADVFHYYYSDAAMTQVIGWTELTCRKIILRHGLYYGGPGFFEYLETHAIYERFDQQACDGDYNGYNICILWVPGSTQDIYGTVSPVPGNVTCPF